MSCVPALKEPEHGMYGNVNNAGGHREVEIPVPIPNTEVKHLCADDTAKSGKVGDCRLFLL